MLRDLIKVPSTLNLRNLAYTYWWISGGWFNDRSVFRKCVWNYSPFHSAETKDERREDLGKSSTYRLTHLNPHQQPDNSFLYVPFRLYSLKNDINEERKRHSDLTCQQRPSLSGHGWALELYTRICREKMDCPFRSFFNDNSFHSGVN